MRQRRTLRRLVLEGYDHRNWYAEQRARIREHCAVNGWDVARFCAVLAITSPRRSVAANWHVADSYMRGDVRPMLGLTRRALAEYAMTGVIRGPKVVAFYNALMGDEAALVLDVWMARALTGRDTIPERTRRLAKRSMHDVAKRMGLSVAQAQAAVWAATIKQHGRKPKGWAA